MRHMGYINGTFPTVNDLLYGLRVHTWQSVEDRGSVHRVNVMILSLDCAYGDAFPLPYGSVDNDKVSVH